MLIHKICHVCFEFLAEIKYFILTHKIKITMLCTYSRQIAPFVMPMVKPIRLFSSIVITREHGSNHILFLLINWILIKVKAYCGLFWKCNTLIWDNCSELDCCAFLSGIIYCFFHMVWTKINMNKSITVERNPIFLRLYNTLSKIIDSKWFN